MPFLNNPDGIEQIKQVAGMLGLGTSDPTPAAAAPPPQGDMMHLLMKAAPLLTELQGEDESIRFLNALRPLLGEERQRKLDDAIKILRLLRLFPMLKNSGLLSALF